MSGTKEMFDDIGGFDGFSFTPCFAEDDDFIIRAKLKGYKLKTTDCAITYHFVSQTSRFSEEYKNDRVLYEINSNRNFVRKWGIPISSFNELRYSSITALNAILKNKAIINKILIFPPFYLSIFFYLSFVLIYFFKKDMI